MHQIITRLVTAVCSGGRLSMYMIEGSVDDARNDWRFGQDSILYMMVWYIVSTNNLDVWMTLTTILYDV